MNWVLIILVLSGNPLGGVALRHIPFFTEVACKAAAKEFSDTVAKRTRVGVIVAECYVGTL